MAAEAGTAHAAETGATGVAGEACAVEAFVAVRVSNAAETAGAAGAARASGGARAALAASATGADGASGTASVAAAEVRAPVPVPEPQYDERRREAAPNDGILASRSASTLSPQQLLRRKGAVRFVILLPVAQSPAGITTMVPCRAGRRGGLRHPPC